MSEGKITVNGKSIYYSEEGAGRPVLYIHGNTGSHLWFRDVMHLPGHRVIAPDMVNFGRSDRIEVSDIDVYADYIEGFLDALGLKDCLVVGHSLGGAVAMSLAFRYGHRVSKLLLVDSSPVGGLKTPEEYYPVIEQYKTNPDLLKAALAGMVPSCSDPEVLNLLADEAMLMNKNSYTGNARALERADFSGRAAGLNKPVLVVRGKLDPLITADAAKATADALGGRYMEIDHVGHSLMVEDPALFREVLIDFDE